MTESVTDASAEEKQGAEGQRVASDDPLEVSRSEVQLALDRRERDVDDTEVELEHKLCGNHQCESGAQSLNRRDSGHARGPSRRSESGMARTVGGTDRSSDRWRISSSSCATCWPAVLGSRTESLRTTRRSRRPVLAVVRL